MSLNTAKKSSDSRTRPLIVSVDDNEAMLFARSAALRNGGFDVLEARSGKEALKVIETRRPALVLLDVNLPDMSGLDLARRLRGDPNLAGVKIVQISATFRTPRDQLDGLETGGADVYLAEPVSADALVSVIRRVLSR
jgi:DNA-binding response OmpR family regulator